MLVLKFLFYQQLTEWKGGKISFIYPENISRGIFSNYFKLLFDGAESKESRGASRREKGSGCCLAVPAVYSVFYNKLDSVLPDSGFTESFV